MQIVWLPPTLTHVQAAATTHNTRKPNKSVQNTSITIHVYAVFHTGVVCRVPIIWRVGKVNSRAGSMGLIVQLLRIKWSYAELGHPDRHHCLPFPQSIHHTPCCGGRRTVVTDEARVCAVLVVVVCLVLLFVVLCFCFVCLPTVRSFVWSTCNVKNNLISLYR